MIFSFKTFAVSVLVISFCLSLTACDAVDAMSATKEIPEKMDQTNSRMSNMLEEMKRTTSGVHDQSLLIPLENILKEENHDSLAPVPFKLMPYGKKFAEAATAQELVDLTYIWIKEVEVSLPTKDIDEATGSEIPYTRRQVANINNEKMARLVALQVIAGFTPQPIVEEIIRMHIVGAPEQGSRRFEDTALAFLMLRAMFIRDVLLQESLLASPLDNIGKVEEAIKYARQIEFIARLRFADKVSFKTRGFIDEHGQQLPVEEQPQEQLKGDVAAKLWRSILEKAQTDLRVVEREVGSNSEEDKKIYEQEKLRAAQGLQTLEDYVRSWEPQS
ncbi:hypothetical protein [Bdellovibrio svalbardensis]|uniref:Lipoprotein n=1 Tax=Bdellovibrio svalbardensis TaxID=2972972 RepID=A0ABT6DFX9_9BACT|nr:hypothetical protein [Bdellovibrio svalbardensis]MDG0815753.1 hypothetical protein [Bdellovibrio svalbardensis]